MYLYSYLSVTRLKQTNTLCSGAICALKFELLLRKVIDMYYKDLETDAKAMQTHNSNQKRNAQERLAKNAAWNKQHKSN